MRSFYSIWGHMMSIEVIWVLFGLLEAIWGHLRSAEDTSEVTLWKISKNWDIFLIFKQCVFRNHPKMHEELKKFAKNGNDESSVS